MGSNKKDTILINNILTLWKTRNITEGDEYPQLVPNNIHMYEKFKGP